MTDTTLRLLVLLGLLGCGLSAPTIGKHNLAARILQQQQQQEQQQQAALAVLPYLQTYQSQPPVQQYIYLNGQPYAILGAQTGYVPAASQPQPVMSPYSATTATAAASPQDTASAAASETKSGAEAEAQTLNAQQSSANADPAVKAVGEGAVAGSPIADTEAGTVTATVTETESVAAERSPPNKPAAAPAPTAEATVPSAASSSSPELLVYQGGAASEQRPLVVSVKNPVVTVQRTESVYSWQHPPQSVSVPVQFTFTRSGQPLRLTQSTPFDVTYTSAPTKVQTAVVTAPAVTRVQWSADLHNGHGATFAANPSVAPAKVDLASAYSQPAATWVPAPSTSAHSVAWTQSPFLRDLADPNSGRSYIVDNEGHVFLSPAAPAASAFAGSSSASAPSSAASAPTVARPYYGAASGLGQQAALFPSSGSAAGDSYKTHDLTALQPAYTPKTFSPVPPPEKFQSPMMVSISTSRDAGAGPATRGDLSSPKIEVHTAPGASLDHLDNPAKPKPLW